MSERNITQWGIVALLGDFFEPLRWIMLAALVIIVVDLRFGVQAARMRGERVRFSRAVRRTANKIVDYCCWIMLAGVIGEAFGNPFGIPMLPLIVLLAVFGCEINSCFSNYFEARGERLTVNIFRFLSRRIELIEPEKKEGNGTANRKDQELKQGSGQREELHRNPEKVKNNPAGQ